MGMFFTGVAGLALCMLVGGIVYGFMVPLQVHFKTGHGALPAPVADDSSTPFVGLALSGGGARAAVFAAAGMEALHDHGLLEQVSHVSSVSGGGFAASYLALHPVDSDAKGYFKQMKHIMAHDFFWDTQVNQLRKPTRVFSPSRRLVSLQDALDRPDFLNAACFADLPKDRTFFFNGVSYDTGHRFVFSNAALPPPDAASAAILPPALRSLSFSDSTRLCATPDQMPVSLAVATSAAFPPYLGPTTVHNDATQEYWHLGDGGTVENTGLETLREAVYARGAQQQAVIYMFNAGQRLDSEASKKSSDISIWSRDVTRLVDVLLEYATAHRDTLFATLDAKHSMDIQVIAFDYLAIPKAVKDGKPHDPRWLSWEGWHHATHADRTENATPADRLARIPTALKITASDKELIAAAAADLVADWVRSTA